MTSSHSSFDSDRNPEDVEEEIEEPVIALPVEDSNEEDNYESDVGAEPEVTAVTVASIDDADDDDNDDDVVDVDVSVDIDDKDGIEKGSPESINKSVTDMTPTKSSRGLRKRKALETPGSDNSDDEEAFTSPSEKKSKRKSDSSTPKKKMSKRKRKTPDKKKGDIPSVKNLEIPFRATKRIMKVDKDIGTVQNEAAMLCTYAVELFIQKFVELSHENSKKRGRNTVRYEDLAEVRANNQNFDFLETLLP